MDYLFQPIVNRVASYPNIIVHDLLDFQSKNWKREILEQIFHLMDIERILKIHIMEADVGNIDGSLTRLEMSSQLGLQINTIFVNMLG